MSTTPDRRISALSVHNVLSHTNIPVENFLKLNPADFSLHVLAFYQSQQQAGEFLSSTYPAVKAQSHGLDWSAGRVRAAIRLVQLLRRISPQIVHVNHTLSAVICSIAARLLTRSKVVTTLHREFTSFSFVHRMCLVLAMCMSHVVVCNSQQTLRQLGPWRRLLGWKDFRVLYNGVDLDRITAATRVLDEAGASSRFVIGTVSRLMHLKDLPTLLLGFAKFHEAHPCSELIVAGDGPQRAQLEHLAQQLKLGPSVRFLGNVSRRKVYELLPKLDLFAVTSTSEGFCNALVEAMAARLPIVASDIPTFREVLGDEVGSYFPAGSADELAQRFAELYANQLYRDQLAAAAEKRARERFGLDVSVQHYSRCYRGVLVSCSRAA